MSYFFLMSHAVLGSLLGLAGVWLFVDVLNAKEENQASIRSMGLIIAILMWLTYLLAGYFYVVDYGADKAIILKGPWTFAHDFFMESKEHVVMMLLLLATYVAIITRNNLAVNKGARKITLWSTALLILTTVAMEGAGAIISMGVRVGCLLSK
jgi:hypothetical protein